MVENKTPNTGMNSVHSFRHAEYMFIFGLVILSFTDVISILNIEFEVYIWSKIRRKIVALQ